MFYVGNKDFLDIVDFLNKQYDCENNKENKQKIFKAKQVAYETNEKYCKEMHELLYNLSLATQKDWSIDINDITE